VNGNGTRLERVKRKKTRKKRRRKNTVRRRYALDGRQASTKRKRELLTCSRKIRR
jgi:hypothetical protein